MHARFKLCSLFLRQSALLSSSKKQPQQVPLAKAASRQLCNSKPHPPASVFTTSFVDIKPTPSPNWRLLCKGPLVQKLLATRGMCTGDAPTPGTNKKPTTWTRAVPARKPGQPSQVTVAQAAQPPEAMWTPVQDPKTGQTYYWNQSTGETTAVGEPMPQGMYREQPMESGYQQVSLMGHIGGMVLWGAGITFGFAIVGVVFRMLFG